MTIIGMSKNCEFYKVVSSFSSALLSSHKAMQKPAIKTILWLINGWQSLIGNSARWVRQCELIIYWERSQVERAARGNE